MIAEMIRTPSVPAVRFFRDISNLSIALEAIYKPLGRVILLGGYLGIGSLVLRASRVF